MAMTWEQVYIIPGSHCVSGRMSQVVRVFLGTVQILRCSGESTGFGKLY